MQNWDLRIENLKANIDQARKKFVLPYLEEVKVDSKSLSNDSTKETKSLEQQNLETSAEEAPKVNAEEAAKEAVPAEKTEEATAEEAPKVNAEEAAKEAAPAEKTEETKSETKPSDKEKPNRVEDKVEKPKRGKKKGKQVKPDLVTEELLQLEAIDENQLTEEQEDRLYELRRIRTQRAMHQEDDESFQDEMKKADKEIKELKAQIKPTKAELAKQGLIE